MSINDSSVVGLVIVNQFYARELAIARISYGNSVLVSCLSVCPGVTSRYHTKLR